MALATPAAELLTIRFPGLELPDDLYLVGAASRVVISRCPASKYPVIQGRRLARVADAVRVLHNSTTPDQVNHAISEWLRNHALR